MMFYGTSKETSERFRVVRVFFGVPGSYGNTGEEVYGPYWALGERERQAARPPLASPNWTRGRGGAPSFLLFPLPLPCLLLLIHGRTPSWTRKGGILLPVGVGLPRARHREGRPSPPPLLYIRGRGHPIDTQVDLRDRFLAVCGAPLHHIPPRIYRCSA